MKTYVIAGGRGTGRTTALIERAERLAPADDPIWYVCPDNIYADNFRKNHAHILSDRWVTWTPNRPPSFLGGTMSASPAVIVFDDMRPTFFAGYNPPQHLLISLLTWGPAVWLTEGEAPEPLNPELVAEVNEILET